MGVWGGLCAFDETRFRKVVVPALRFGADHPVVERAARQLWAYGAGPEGFKDEGHYEYPSATPPLRFEGLAGVMAHVDDTFRRCGLGRDYRVVDGVPTTTTEPYSEHGWGYWELVELVEWVLTREAILAYTVLGRQGENPWRALRLAGRIEETAEDLDQRRLGQLLRRLDSRMHSVCFWMHGGGGYLDGICGWLDAAEARELATLLPSRREPDDEPTTTA
ncbi:hypothetical protein IU459_36225 [Nocardia amamiensis]|uniref:Uncharacterized protein n=1 Tax=Nocardia amamiensis TaxID=404578 RepID=A0ABS0D262_9NOCA|nr:hypothetical protein [Nocardia amamiensis]MBF6302926.1 hypothetical protein [Nocardia amamiensis]